VPAHSHVVPPAHTRSAPQSWQLGGAPQGTAPVHSQRSALHAESCKPQKAQTELGAPHELCESAQSQVPFDWQNALSAVQLRQALPFWPQVSLLDGTQVLGSEQQPAQPLVPSQKHAPLDVLQSSPLEQALQVAPPLPHLLLDLSLVRQLSPSQQPAAHDAWVQVQRLETQSCSGPQGAQSLPPLPHWLSSVAATQVDLPAQQPLQPEVTSHWHLASTPAPAQRSPVVQGAVAPQRHLPASVQRLPPVLRQSLQLPPRVPQKSALCG
jgi:hypothetical protein